MLLKRAITKDGNHGIQLDQIDDHNYVITETTCGVCRNRHNRNTMLSAYSGYLRCIIEAQAINNYDYREIK